MIHLNLELQFKQKQIWSRPRHGNVHRHSRRFEAGVLKIIKPSEAERKKLMDIQAELAAEVTQRQTGLEYQIYL